MLEFQIALRSIGKKLPIVKTSTLGLRKAIEVNRGEEVNTINSTLLARQCEIEEKYGLTHFDSLIAASTLSVDEGLISDDNAFGRVPGIRRASLSSKSRV
jgi:predicted nucleic acid-binding protein